MREPVTGTFVADEADSEIELDAQALRELAVPSAAVDASTEAARLDYSASKKADTAPSAVGQVKRPEHAEHRGSAIPRITAAAALVIGSLAAGTAVYVAANSRVEPASAMVASHWGSEVFASAEEPVEEQVEQSVLFANPFDPTEVFRFPAGTSPAEARERVAQALIERAAQRQLHASN